MSQLSLLVELMSVFPAGSWDVRILSKPLSVLLPIQSSSKVPSVGDRLSKLVK